MSSGWGSLEAKSNVGGENPGEATETITDINEALSTKTSGLESLEAMSLREQEETAKGPESIGTDTDDETAIDAGIHISLVLINCGIPFCRADIQIAHNWEVYDRE